MRSASKRVVSPVEADRIITQYKSGNMALTEALHQLSTDGSVAPSHSVPPALTRERFLDLLSQLDSLVGLEQVKLTVRQIFAFLYMQECRRQSHLRVDPVVLHMVFKGSPGTGKTTVARILANLFRDCGLLEKGHVVEVERADLVGEYIGHTAQKTRDLIRKAQGGVLFIDEAYSLARGGERDFGREAIDCLVKGMEDHCNQFIAIIAGYELEMDWFLATNPGLPSRFPIHITFPDYSPSTLMEIARRMTAERQYRLSTEAEFKFRRYVEALLSRPPPSGEFSNGRWVRNAVEQSIRKQALRLFETVTPTRDQLLTIEAVDLDLGGVKA